MIVDVPRFIATEQPYWQELEKLLVKLETETNKCLSLEEVKRFHFLYERAAAGLSRLTAHTEPDTHKYLENLVGRAYGEIHETRGLRTKFHPLKWFIETLPQTFRKHLRAFQLSLAITIVGALFGALAVALDPEAKAVITPFPHLLQDPADRVAKEESAKDDRLKDSKASFSAYLMTHNTRVSILTLASGISWGVGTVILLFYNGIIIGAIALDYIRAGQTAFLFGWLLPHGSIEIPAILIAGQAGLVLAKAMIGWGNRDRLGQRLRAVGGDIVTLIAGVGILLIWAGIIESFFSQYHAPVIPYWLKIGFGAIELVLLFLFLLKSGTGKKP